MPDYSLSTILNLALLALELFSNSSVEAVIDFLLIILTLAFLSQMHIGNFGGQIHVDAKSLNVFFTIRSSNE